ncbi:hypothetical protein KEM52_001418, partial [Ascosphaera acerosa]
MRSTLPLAACAVSLSLLLLSGACHVASQLIARARGSYQPLSGGASDDLGNGGLYSDDYDEANDPDLMLHKAITNASMVDDLVEDVPRGRRLASTLEMTLVLLQITVAALTALRQDRQPSGTHWSVEALIASLVSWLYIGVIVILRHIVATGTAATASQREPTRYMLWNHAVSLYACRWLLDVFLFRSALIHPDLQYPARRSTVIAFVLSSALLTLSLGVRKGQKTLLVQQQNGLTPPPDQTASLFSLATYSWLDPLIWRGFKAPLEIQDVWNLRPAYHASAVLRHWRATYRAHSLALSLLVYFKRPLLVQGAWTVLSSCLVFAPTWLLKLVLEYVQDPDGRSENAAWLYVGLMFCSATLEAVANGQSLWIGRKLSVKLRAIIVGELYAKALRRKAGASAVSKTAGTTNGTAGDRTASRSSDAVSAQQPTVSDPVSRDDIEGNDDSKSSEEDDEDEASVGKILNLMAIDSFKTSEICAYLHFLWASVPVQILVSVGLLYKILGSSAFAGIGLMALILPLNMFVARRFVKVQAEILAATDERIHATNEALTNIRIIKYFAWEAKFEDIIDEKRR